MGVYGWFSVFLDVLELRLGDALKIYEFSLPQAVRSGIRFDIDQRLPGKVDRGLFLNELAQKTQAE